MEQLYSLGWHLCALRPRICMNWRGDLIFRKDQHIFILETIRGKTAAKITADIVAPVLYEGGFHVYYAHMDYMDSIRGIYEWHPNDHVMTLFL
tara:strand:+ start:232 stop:510 length:279 start_codon:yes stop_codon:yes gene_type:complete